MKKTTRLFNRNFFLLWQGQFVSQLGSQAFAIAMMFWIKHQTGSASLMGLMLMISRLPAVILGPIGGTFADHYSRRKIIIVSDLLAGVFVTVLALFVFYFSNSTGIILAWLFSVSLLLGIIRAFFNPAITASIPDIVPKDKVSAANSLNQASFQISMFFGQALGGYLFILLGAPLLFLIDGITYLFSAGSETFIKIPQVLPEKRKNGENRLSAFKKDIIDGFKYVWLNKGIRDLFFSMAFLNFFIMPFIVLLPFYVEDFLFKTADWYGYILAGFGFGSLVGYGFAGTLKISGKTRSHFTLFSLILMSACLPLFSIITKAPPAIILMVVTGILNGFFNINVITVLQVNVPGEMRGRIFGLLTTITAGITPISMGLSGVIGDLLGQNVPLIYAISGIMTVILSILVSFSKDLRQFLSLEPADSPESREDQS